MRAGKFAVCCLALGLVGWVRLGAQTAATPGNMQAVSGATAAAPVNAQAAGAGGNAASVPAAAAPAVAAVAYDKEPLPKDPAAALLLASKANGLGGEGLKPWYLKMHYQAFDAQGKPAAKGVFELYWEGPEHYRVSYVEDGFSQTTYSTPEANYEVGDTKALPYAASLIWQQVMSPVVLWPKAPVPQSHERKSGTTRLNCLELRVFYGAPADAYCLGEENAALRAAEQGGYTVIYNRIVVFQHRFSAGQISVLEDRYPVLTLDLDSLRGMQPADAPALVPPADARRTESFKNLSTTAASQGGTAALAVAPRVLAGKIINKAQPIYPAEAKSRRAQGTVRIAATIGKDGLVHDLVVVHDPDASLSQAALDAVSKWRYQPYLLDGAPVEVHTTILVTFRLGG